MGPRAPTGRLIGLDGVPIWLLVPGYGRGPTSHLRLFGTLRRRFPFQVGYEDDRIPPGEYVALVTLETMPVYWDSTLEETITMLISLGTIEIVSN